MSSKLTSGLQKQYLLVLAVIGSLAIFGAVLLEVVVVSQGKGAEIINIAGRQRMLSQRIDLYSNRLSQTTSPIEIQEIKRELNQAIDLFKSSHDYLRQNSILKNAPSELSTLYNHAPHQIDQHILRLLTNLDRMMMQSERNTPIDPKLISQISLLCETLLPKLDRVVSIHQADQEEKTAKLRTYQWLNLVVLLSVLILSGVFVFQRMLNRLQGQVDHIAEAEERFRSITHSAEISVVVASGQHGLIEAWNPAAERTFGYSSAEAVGQPVTMLMPERYRDTHDESLHHAYFDKDHTMIGHTIELEALHKDGHEFPIELSLGSWQSKGQKYFSAIIHDITERKKNEQERENLRQQLVTAIESMTEGFALFDKEDRLVIFNSVFCDFYKNHVDSIHVGQTLENILRSGLKKRSFPEAVGREEEWLAERMELHLNPKGPVEQLLQDGRWLSISEQKTKDGGVVGVRTDITQRRNREAELRKLKMAIEQSRSIILITDANGIIEYANPYFTQITGYSNDEIIGQKPNFFSQNQASKLKDGDIWKTILSGNVWQGRIENHKKDGTPFIEETVISPIRDDKGKITHFLAIQDDITEQLRLEDVIKKQQKLEAVGQLAGGLAHDFNNLLAIISGNLELLLRLVNDNDNVRKKVETALKASNRGAKLTKQLLGFTRQSPTSIETANVNDIITEISPLLEHSLSKSIKLKLQLSDDIHLVDIDPGDFEDCLVNLAVNAKHAISHDGELLIETTNIDSVFEQENTQDTYVQITISDNGCGIPADIQDKIFEPFFSTKEKGHGTGMGLAMVFGFVRRSRGYIRVYSEEGVGTSFKIFLPRSSKDIQTAPCSPAQQKELPGGNEHILLVDDETELLELAKTNLEHAGYRVTTTHSATEAITILKESGDIDLLFSDVIMPGKINGFDLAIMAQQVSPRTKIQLTSGYTAQAGQDLIEGNIFAKQLYQNLLSKPYTQAALLQAVRRVLDAEILIEWSEYLDTGVPLIDDDHKMLVAILNRLYQACLYKENEKIFHSILEELAHYTKYHFQREENFMEEIGYPHLKNHKQVHKLLASFVMAELNKVQDHYNTKNGDELLHFLKNWLIDHIMGMDQDIGSFISHSTTTSADD
ncbi:bacteriohemerythrin [Terasakiella sp.]|uniref:bacteriohemerythrin n=1 Tax=Terasakiella sp. TaxID=2034861 RepID=UPI003AA7DD72